MKNTILRDRRVGGSQFELAPLRGQSLAQPLAAVGSRFLPIVGVPVVLRGRARRTRALEQHGLAHLLLRMMVMMMLRLMRRLEVRVVGMLVGGRLHEAGRVHGTEETGVLVATAAVLERQTVTLDNRNLVQL